MKYIIAFLTIVFFYSCTNSSTNIIICGKIKSPKPFTLRIYEPINGYYNNYQFDTTHTNAYLVSSDSFYYINTHISVPSFLYIDFYVDNQFSSRSVFLLTPGDSTNMQIDLSDANRTWVKFSGSNSNGNNLFNTINYIPDAKYEPVKKLMNNTVVYDPDTYEKLIDDITDSSVQSFKQLLAEKKISREYYNAMRKTFQLLFYERVISRLISKNKTSDSIDVLKRNTIVENLFKQLPITDPEIKPLFLSQLYFTNYFFYQALKEKNVVWVDDLHKEPYIIAYKDSTITVDRLLAHLPLIKDDQDREDMWANYMSSTFIYLKGYFNDSVITQFALLFPNSNYLPFIKALYAREITNAPSQEYNLLSPINILDSTRRIKTIDQIATDVFKGKSLYIDIWATWCAPCISEFSFNKHIDSFLLANNIERIYISVDQKGYEKPWIKAIEKFKLGGFHILAGTNLASDLKRVSGIKSDGAFAIPRYLIINKKGEIVNINAARPSDGDVLIEQLRKIL